MYLETYTGKRFYHTNPRPEDIDIVDIAHALSNLCRYAGHCKFYSVGEHSIRMSYIVPPHLALEALLHDATEAYMVDMPRSLKDHLPRYVEMERALTGVIREALGLPGKTYPKEIKHWDDVMLVTEGRDFGFSWWNDEGRPDPHPGHVAPWTIDFTENLFLQRYHALKKLAARGPVVG